MSFPLSPSDGDTFLTSLGVLYKYDDTRLSWLIQSGAGGNVGPGTPNKVAIFNGTGTTIGNCDAGTGVLLGSKDSLTISCYDTSSEITIITYDETNTDHSMLLTSTSSGSRIDWGSSQPIMFLAENYQMIATGAGGMGTITLSPKSGAGSNLPITFITTASSECEISSNNQKLILDTNSFKVNTSAGGLDINGIGDITITVCDSYVNPHVLQITATSSPAGVVITSTSGDLELDAGNIILLSNSSTNGVITISPYDSGYGNSSLDIGTDSGGTVDITVASGNLNISTCSGFISLSGADNIYLINLPTSPSGLGTGGLYNAAGFLKVA